MFSTLLELAGFGALIAAAVLLGGLVAGLLTAGPILLLLGYATDDQAAVTSLVRASMPARRRVLAFRAARSARRARRQFAKAG